MRRWDEHSNYRLCHCCMALIKSAKNVSETVVESTCNLISALEFHHGCLHIWHQPHTHRHTYSALHQARRDSLDGIVPFTHPVQNIEPQNVCVSDVCALPIQIRAKEFHQWRFFSVMRFQVWIVWSLMFIKWWTIITVATVEPSTCFEWLSHNYMMAFMIIRHFITA